MNGHLTVVQYLVEQGVDINAHENAALLSSAEHGNLEVLQYLVENGSNNGVNNNLVAMLHYDIAL
jgi:ankyrin repeat protein